MIVLANPAVLRTANGAPVPLQDVEVRALLRDLVSEVAVTQSYRNAETVAIEAIYTFPLPPEAVLLEVEATIGGKRRQGEVVERKQAEEAYERGIEAGDAAIMIERPALDLYTMNVGNLLPGEAATIAFRYAMILRRQRGRIRFLHPTTIAPRYGRSPLQPHQEPEHSLFDERAGRLELEITGMLAHGAVRSPSHEIETERSGNRLLVRLRNGRLLMDRDFVLDIHAAEAMAPVVLCEPDREGGHAACAILHPDLPASLEAPPRDLKIVLDCSGSMQGDSIGQARVAVQRILEALRPQDRFNVVLFGSNHRVLFPEMMAGDDRAVAEAQRIVLDAMADMGGTEMGKALDAAYALPTRGRGAATLMLVTDGEVGDTAPILHAARASGHRLFTVGVGSAVAEGLVQDLARSTGGACELVAPREDMAERIVRHFRRIDQGGARLAIDWPAAPREVSGLNEPVFAGDTAIVFARFDAPPAGEARISVTLPDGRAITDRATILPADASAVGSFGTIARLGAAWRLFEFGRRMDAAPASERGCIESQAAALAFRYQLLSPWTNWLLVVAQDGQAAGDLPVVRKVAQTLAAGWHGVGTVKGLSSPMPMVHDSPPVEYSRAHDVPAFLRREASMPLRESPTPRSKRGRVLAARIFGESEPRIAPRLEDLAGLPGVGPEVLAALRALIDGGLDEGEVVAAFLLLLAAGSLGPAPDRHARRQMNALRRGISIGADVTARVRAAVAGRMAVPAEGASA